MYIQQNVLNQSCVVESWRSVQSEVHQEKARLASEVEAMQATANVKHDEIVRQVAQERGDAAPRGESGHRHERGTVLGGRAASRGRC